MVLVEGAEHTKRLCTNCGTSHGGGFVEETLVPRIVGHEAGIEVRAAGESVDQEPQALFELGVDGIVETDWDGAKTRVFRIKVTILCEPVANPGVLEKMLVPTHRRHV